MTNVSATPEKVELRQALSAMAIQALERDGWEVTRVQGGGKSSVRRITKGGVSKLVSIRTSQNTWIAFPRDKKDQAWGTLSEVDAVVAVSVDDADTPRFAQVHMIDADEMRDRFDRAYNARKAAGHSIPIGRGVWISLYHHEGQNPVNRVGAGAGLKHPPIARISLTSGHDIARDADDHQMSDAMQPLTIAEAKEGLALTFGVSAANVKITIEA